MIKANKPWYNECYFGRKKSRNPHTHTLAGMHGNRDARYVNSCCFLVTTNLKTSTVHTNIKELLKSTSSQKKRKKRTHPKINTIIQLLNKELMISSSHYCRGKKVTKVKINA